MSDDKFLLAKGIDSEGSVIEVNAKPFYRTGSLGVADSVQTVEASGLVRVPSYMIVAGRAVANSNEPVWSNFSDSYGERLTLKDKKNILGNGKSRSYVVDIQNGGVFMGNHEKIRKAVQKNKLVKYAMPLDQKTEVNPLLEAIKTGDVSILKEFGWTKSDSVYVFDTFEDFNDASSANDFLVNDPAYVVLRKANEARTETSGYRPISEQRNNQSLIIASSGRVPLGKMLDQAESFGWESFGSWHDGYENANSGRVVVLYNSGNGVSSSSNISGSGRSLGVAPEELAKREKIVGPVPLEKVVEEAAPSEDVRMIPESLVKRLLTDHLGYADATVDEHLEVLASYQSK